MKIGTKQAAVYLCTALLLVGSHGSIKPDSTVEKCALGALAAVGVGAVGCLAWNSDYYSAEGFLRTAEYDEQAIHDTYGSMMRLSSSCSAQDLINEITREHARARNIYDLREEYSLLWYADKLANKVSALRSAEKGLREYASIMARHPKYYRKLSGKRAVMQDKVESTLSRIEPVLSRILSLDEYQKQEKAYHKEHERRERERRLENERRQIQDFKHKLSDVRITFEGISSDFSREYDRLMLVTAIGDFEQCLSAIIFNKYGSCHHYHSNQRARYAALWYEERINEAIRSLERAYDDLHSRHRTVCTYEQYYSYGLESEYSEMMSRMNNHLIRLRDTRDRLLNTYFYRADLRAYELACREYHLCERERIARQREYEAECRAREAQARAWEAEHYARQCEYAADCATACSINVAVGW